MPVMMSRKNELEMDAMFISSIQNLLRLHRVNDRGFFSALINDPGIHPEPNDQKEEHSPLEKYAIQRRFQIREA